MSILAEKRSFLSSQTNRDKSRTNYLYEPVENKIASIQTQDSPPSMHLYTQPNNLLSIVTGSTATKEPTAQSKNKLK